VEPLCRIITEHCPAEQSSHFQNGIKPTCQIGVLRERSGCAKLIDTLVAGMMQLRKWALCNASGACVSGKTWVVTLCVLLSSPASAQRPIAAPPVDQE